MLELMVVGTNLPNFLFLIGAHQYSASSISRRSTCTSTSHQQSTNGQGTNAGTETSAAINIMCKSARERIVLNATMLCVERMWIVTHLECQVCDDHFQLRYHIQTSPHVLKRATIKCVT